MHDQFDNNTRSTSGFTRRNVEDTRFDAAFVARFSVFVTLLVIGTLPLSFFFTTNFSPFIIYVLFYSVLGAIAFALRTPSCEGVREDANERYDGKGGSNRTGSTSSDAETGS